MVLAPPEPPPSCPNTGHAEGLAFGFRFKLKLAADDEEEEDPQPLLLPAPIGLSFFTSVHTEDWEGQ